MSIKTLALASLVYVTLATPPALAFDYPVLPAKVSSIEAAVPPGWKIIKDISRGDLNQDGVEDVALVIERLEPVDHVIISKLPDNVPEEWQTNTSPRVLLALFGNGDGSFSMALANSDVIYRADMGGMMGDPFWGLRIERGSIVLEELGGSRERWGEIARYRFRKGKWRLIGATSTTLDTMDGKATETDRNYLSGKTKFTEFKNEETPVNSKWSKIRADQRRQYLKSNLRWE